MTTPTPSELVELAEREAYEIGLRDGYSKAVQDIDQLTGGDGEYCYCMNARDSERHCPDPEAMKRRIVERFEEARSSQENSHG